VRKAAIGGIVTAFAIASAGDAMAACDADACDAGDTTCEDLGCILDAGGVMVCGHLAYAGEGTLCGDPSDDDCTDPDTCDGFGSCLPNHAGEAVACGDPSTTDCTFPDECNGSGTCLRNDRDDGADCTDDGNACTSDGCIAGVCSHPPTAPGSACDLPGLEGPCEDDACDGAGACVLSDRPDGADCDDGEFCNGQRTCAAGECVEGDPPCPPGDCDEAGDACSGGDADSDVDVDSDSDSDTDADSDVDSDTDVDSDSDTVTPGRHADEGGCGCRLAHPGVAWHGWSAVALASSIALRRRRLRWTRRR
jgi:hypothetical protein